MIPMSGSLMTMAAPKFEAGQCANCDSFGVTPKSPLYCSERCSQAAGLVRYIRGCRRDGRDLKADVQEAIRTRMAMVLGGGYPEQARRVPTEVRRLVFDRAHGHCEECGRELDFDQSGGDPDAVATIQHVDGNSSDPSNLKAFCRHCNTVDAQSKFVPVEPGSAEAEFAAELRIRWLSEDPIRLCDDDLHWKDIWRDLTSEAKLVIEANDGLVESAGDEDIPGFLGWTDQGTPIHE